MCKPNNSVAQHRVLCDPLYRRRSALAREFNFYEDSNFNFFFQTLATRRMTIFILDRSVETLGLWIVTSTVTLIKSANQSSVKLCLIVHLVAVWTLIDNFPVVSDVLYITCFFSAQHFDTCPSNKGDEHINATHGGRQQYTANTVNIR